MWNWFTSGGGGGNLPSCIKKNPVEYASILCCCIEETGAFLGKVFNDFPGKLFFNFAVSGDSLIFPGLGIFIPVMIRTMPDKNCSVFLDNAQSTYPGVCCSLVVLDSGLIPL
jgi:hypothetical protein